MRKILLALCVIALCCPAFADVKIRDIAKVDGIGEQQISGYGLVVGLNATGDQTTFTMQSFADTLARLGVTVTPEELNSRSVAAVIVTAKLPSFARSGQTLDVTLSVIGNAKSLAGGTLLMTPLYLPEGGEPYATAQGPLSIGGTTGGATIKSHLTVARIPGGATIERSTENAMDTSKFDLAFQSLGNVVNAKTAINSYMGEEIATVTSPSSVTVDIPLHLQNSYYDFLNTVLNLEIQPETFAKVVMEERTGTVVMGADVRISTVAVSYGNMTITIASSAELPPDANGNIRGADATDTQGRVMMVPEGATVSDLVKALNSIGVAPGDMISIFQAIKAAGALHAELEVI
jgi:flagellar P-ring protein precursor FlgI